MSRLDTYKYPTYLVWRERTKFLSTAPRSISLRAMSAKSYYLNSAVASVKDRCLLAMTKAEAPEVIILVAPGLAGGKKAVAERVM